MLPALPDLRLRRRFERIVSAVSKQPDRSYPRALPDSAELEGLYRFLSNERVDWQQLLLPEITQTAARIADAGAAYAIHDSSSMMMTGEAPRGDVGSLDGHGASFLGHVCLAVSIGKTPGPLGLLGVEALFRPDGPRSRQQRSTKPDWQEVYDSDDKESLRWPRMVEQAEAQVEGRGSLIHLMDSEGDDYALMASLVGKSRRFVIRVRNNRVLADGGGRLEQALATVEAVACRQVSVGARSKAACHGRKTKHQPRQPRVAKLQISARRVFLRRPDHVGPTICRTLQLNVVHVREIDAPEGCEAVDWKLYTSEPIETPEQIIAVVDHYRVRWMIEEYFKALKTGCSFEKRQVESRRALLNTLALYAPIACRLLALRHESRAEGVATSLTPRQIKVLRAMRSKPLPENPTPRELMLAVAGLGGHIKNNGDPGWLVLGRGYLDLLAFEAGWAARERSDQS
jgi:tRNA (Thr-GGU) A37 N-methylase